MSVTAPFRYVRSGRASRATGAVLIATLLTGWPAAAATPWKADAAESRLTFAATQAGARFDGAFQEFETTIVFDPADLAGSRFRVAVATATADTRDAERDATLKGKEFFDATRWPKATFETTEFKSLGKNRYEALGRLTIRDVTRNVRLPFTFTAAADGRTATLAGGTTVSRLDFGVGQGEWTDTTWVGNPVEIRFELRLTRGP
jgi:polyisoprenoid-binding protein YceI